MEDSNQGEKSSWKRNLQRLDKEIESIEKKGILSFPSLDGFSKDLTAASKDLRRLRSEHESATKSRLVDFKVQSCLVQKMMMLILLIFSLQTSLHDINRKMKQGIENHLVLQALLEGYEVILHVAELDHKIYFQAFLE